METYYYKMTTYNPYPLGQVPLHLQRVELEEVKQLGYNYEDARELITIFEKKIAEFAGSNFAVLTDCCTHAIELSILYEMHRAKLTAWNQVCIPENTYVSVGQSLDRLFHSVRRLPMEWHGIYTIEGTRVIDSAVRWKRGMYVKESLQCLSFQIKKPIPIGRGGAILCTTREEYEWLKLASYDGRDLNTAYDDPKHVKIQGYHYYMTPEDAARGIILMDSITFEGDVAGWQNYPKH